MKMNAPGAPPPHRLPVLTEVVLTEVVLPGDAGVSGGEVRDDAEPAPRPVAAAEPLYASVAAPQQPVSVPIAAPMVAPPIPAVVAPPVLHVTSPENESPHESMPASALDGRPAPPEWLKRRPAQVHVGLPLPSMAPPSPLPADFSGSWWSRDEGPAIVASPVPVPVPIPAPLSAPVSAPVAPPVSEDALVHRVLDGLGGQIDLMFDHRMREAVVPALARAADLLIEDLKTELAKTLHEMVSRAVVLELARERERRDGS